MSSFLDKTGLSYFWEKIKEYISNNTQGKKIFATSSQANAKLVYQYVSAGSTVQITHNGHKFENWSISNPLIIAVVPINVSTTGSGSLNSTTYGVLYGNYSVSNGAWSYYEFTVPSEDYINSKLPDLTVKTYSFTLPKGGPFRTGAGDMIDSSDIAESSYTHTPSGSYPFTGNELYYTMTAEPTSKEDGYNDSNKIIGCKVYSNKIKVYKSPNSTLNYNMTITVYGFINGG